MVLDFMDLWALHAFLGADGGAVLAVSIMIRLGVSGILLNPTFVIALAAILLLAYLIWTISQTHDDTDVCLGRDDDGGG
jgi:hypothetical protein